MALYKDYLGERASGLQATGLLYPLSLRAAASDEKRLVRMILAVDEATQSLTFAGDIPEGSLAQLMQANFDRLVQGAADAALATTERSHGLGPTRCRSRPDRSVFTPMARFHPTPAAPATCTIKP